jgi:hypothetical protein
MTGYIQLDLPSFDPSKNLTMSAWILGGSQGGNASAISIECVEESCSLVNLWSENRQDIFQVHRRTSRAPVRTTAPEVSSINSKVKFQRGAWIHVAYVEHDKRMFLYMDGVLAANGSLPAIKHDTVTKVSLGRSIIYQFIEAFS